MRTKVTLVLLFLNVALFYCIFQFAAPNTDRDRTNKVLPPTVAAMDRIEIRLANTPAPLVLEKRGDRWMLASPYEWPADRNAVDRLVNELVLLKSEANFEVGNLADTGQSLADYGLDPALATVAVRVGDQDLALEVGAATQVQNRLYVLSPDRTRIHVVGRTLVEALSLGPAELRDTSLVDIPVFEARSLSVQLPAPSNLRVRLARSGPRWIFESPIQTRAERNAVELALNRLHELRVAHFVDNPPAGLPTGLETPSFRITVEGNQRRVILLLGAPLPVEAKPGVTFAETEFFAKLEDRAALFTVKVEDALLDSLRRAQSELRDRHLLDFAPDELNAISLTAPGRPEVALQKLETGAWQVLSRTDNEVAPPQPADRAIVDRLVGQLANLRAAVFHSDAPFPADLEQWGFNRPEREVTLNFASGGVGAGEPVTLQLGVATSVDNTPLTYARVGDAQFVYLVPSSILDELPVGSRHFRLRTLRDLPPGARITGISLRRLADNSVVFARELAIGETWESALAGSKAATRDAITALRAELRTLQARDFVRDSFTTELEIDGQREPWVYQLDATIALSGAMETGGQSGTSTLMLGERRGGSGMLVGSAEFNTVFHATQPLLDAVFTLTFGDRDPGAPAPQPATEAATPPAESAD